MKKRVAVVNRGMYLRLMENLVGIKGAKFFFINLIGREDILGRDYPHSKALSATLVSRPFSCPSARAAAARAVEQF